MTAPTQEYLHVSWDDFYKETQNVAKKLSPTTWKGIIAITRGGLVPAAILARILDVRYIETLGIASYEESNNFRGPLRVLKEVPAESIAQGGDGYLVVDDLVDSGTTLKITRELLPKAHILTIYAKPEGCEFTDSHGTIVPQTTWIVFPWEVD